MFDETGDTGIGPRSSRFLVMAGVVCSNLDPLRRAVARTRKSLGKKLRDIPELKAWHSPAGVTAQLLSRVAALDVEIYAAILDKRLSGFVDILHEIAHAPVGRRVRWLKLD